MEILREVRLAERALRRQPVFSAVAILTLALGIGATSAVFSAVYSVLLRPLPYRDPSRLYVIWEDATRLGFPENTPAPANYADWKAESRSFEDMAAVADKTFVLTGVDEPEELFGFRATGNLFSVLGVSPHIGRTFTEEDDRPGAAPAAILAHRLWHRRFGADPSILGKTIRLDGQPVAVIGVMPPSFTFWSRDAELFVPFRASAEEMQNRSSHYLWVIGRLRSNVSSAEAQAEMTAIARRLELSYPETNTDLGARIEPLTNELVGDLRPVLLVLFGAVGILLLIACANVTNLFLARGTARARETAMRLSLGASTSDLARQLTAETALMALVASGAGIVLAHFGLQIVEGFLTGVDSPTLEIGVNGAVLAFAIVLAGLTSFLSAILPAAGVSRLDLSTALKEGGGTTGGRMFLRRAVVVAEVAMALTLLVGGALLTRSLVRLLNVPLGFEPRGALTVRTTLPSGKYDSLRERELFYRQVLERIRKLPGVEAAGYTSALPLTFSGNNWMFSPEGQPEPPPGQERIASLRVVTPNFFRAMGMTVLRGRSFEDSDDVAAMPVAIINEQMARQFWPGEDALGRRFRLGRSDDLPWYTIIAIVTDVRQWGVAIEPRPEMYFSSAQADFTPPRNLVVRTGLDPASLTGAVRESIRSVDPDQPMSAATTLEEIVRDSLARERLQAWLVGGFALAALLLASVGLYGVMSFEVAQRTREIGVRVALGARPAAVLALVLRQGMGLALLGTVLGVGGALGLSRLIENLLFGTKGFDPAMFALGSGSLLAVALAACFFPARRATRVDPLVALRAE